MIHIDIETTGASVIQDRIVELYLYNDVTEQELHFFVNPEIPCSKEAEDKHGYTAEFLADKPRWVEVSVLVIPFIKDEKEFCGYNIKGFDVPLLSIELDRVGFDFEVEELRLFDSYEVWSLCEPRTLEGAMQKFLIPEDYSGLTGNFHGAKYDTHINLKVWQKMKDYFMLWDLSQEQLQNEIEGMIEKKRKEKAVKYRTIDPAGKLGYNEDGKIVFLFGKYDWNLPVNQAAKKTVAWAFKNDWDYIKYLIEKSETNGFTKYHLYKLRKRWEAGK